MAGKNLESVNVSYHHKFMLTSVLLMHHLQHGINSVGNGMKTFFQIHGREIYSCPWTQ